MFELILMFGVVVVFLGAFSFLPRLSLPTNTAEKKQPKQKATKIDPEYHVLYNRWFDSACKTYKLEGDVSVRTFPDMCIPDAFTVVSGSNGFEVVRKRPSLLKRLREDGFEG